MRPRAEPRPAASIIILTKEGGAVFRETLRAVLDQRFEGGFEVLVIDSASRDGTAEAAEQLLADPANNARAIPGRVVRIAADEFGHGRTRNMGGRLASGELLVFLSQDATPAGNGWLAALLRPFAEPGVVGAFCRQVARPGARLPERFILQTAYPAASARRSRDSLKHFDAGYILFSNAASAIRREVLETFPFAEDLMMCEDQQWAVRVLRAGHRIAYVAEARVDHSHHYTLRAILARNFDYAVSFTASPETKASPGGYLRYVRRELAFVLRRGGPGAVPWTLGFEAARVLGYLLGTHYRRLPVWLCKGISGYPRWFDGRRDHRSAASTAEHPRAG